MRLGGPSRDAGPSRSASDLSTRHAGGAARTDRGPDHSAVLTESQSAYPAKHHSSGFGLAVGRPADGGVRWRARQPARDGRDRHNDPLPGPQDGRHRGSVGTGHRDRAGTEVRWRRSGCAAAVHLRRGRDERGTGSPHAEPIGGEGARVEGSGSSSCACTGDVGGVPLHRVSALRRPARIPPVGRSMTTGPAAPGTTARGRGPCGRCGTVAGPMRGTRHGPARGPP
jgi:hypothetical protein